MGSPALASFIAHLVFWGLVVWGLVAGELTVRAAALFVMLWFLSSVGLAYLPFGTPLFPSIVAVLDIVLVFIVFKGDVRLT